MASCPHCGEKINLEMFFIEKKGLLGKTYVFKGQKIRSGFQRIKMWECPHCGRVLGFSEYRWDS